MVMKVVGILGHVGAFFDANPVFAGWSLLTQHPSLCTQ